jgi:hypothetical protein
VPVLLDEAVMQGWKLYLDVPLLGEAKISSALVFDIGVAAVVIGLVFMVFEAFGDDESPEYRGEVPSGPAAGGTEEPA